MLASHCCVSVVRAEDESSALYYWLSSSFLNQARCESKVKARINATVTSALRAHRETELRNDVDGHSHTHSHSSQLRADTTARCWH